MSRLTMTRRNFVKAAAVTGAAVALASAGVVTALTEDAHAASTETGGVEHLRSCCRSCGKVECGVWVTVQNGKVIRVEGDETNPHSRGHCCAKSQSAIQICYHPDRMRYPVKRNGAKGEDPNWQRITLDEAFQLCGEGLGVVQQKYGGNSIEVMCGTSRIWSLGPYQGMKQLFKTGNAHLAYQVCKGPRHWAGIMTDEMGSPWMEVEQGETVYVQWGTAVEYSNYDTTNRTVNDIAQNSYCHIDIDPRVSPCGKEADIWLPLRPGTDGALGLAWLKLCDDNDWFDDTMLRRWSNAPFLYCPTKDPTGGWSVEGNGGIDFKTRLVTEADLDPASLPWTVTGDGNYRRFVFWDAGNDKLTYWDDEAGMWEGEKHEQPTTGIWIEHPYKPLVKDGWLPDDSHFADPATESSRFPDGSATCNPKGVAKVPDVDADNMQLTFKDGTKKTCRSVWQGFRDMLADYDLASAEKITGVKQDLIEEACRVWTNRVHPEYGNGGLHFQLATDQNGNSIVNCRTLMVLSELTGNADTPGGNRGSSKSQFDGNPGRSNMWGTKELTGVPYDESARKTWSGRDKSRQEVADWMQTFVTSLVEQEAANPGTTMLSPRSDGSTPYGTLAECKANIALTGNPMTNDYALVVADRMGGAFKSSAVWPNPKTIFDRDAQMICAERFPLNRYWARWADARTIWEAGMLDDQEAAKEIFPHIDFSNIPYAIHGGLCQSGDMMNMDNNHEAWEALKRFDFYTDINLWHCPNNDCADVIFPCTMWLEIDSTRVSQGAGGFFGCCVQAVEPPAECIYDPDWNVGMYKCMGIPWNTKDTSATPSSILTFGGYSVNGAEVPMDTDYRWPDQARVLKDNVDAWKTAEFPNGSTWAQAKEWFQTNGWMDCREWHPERWGTWKRHEMCWRRQQGGFNLYPLVDDHPGFMTATGMVEVWSTVAEAYEDNNETWYGYMTESAEGYKMKGAIDDGDFKFKDCYPIYREPMYGPVSTPKLMEEYPFIMTTGSRQPVYFHSEHRQIPYCRELWPCPRVELNPADAAELGVEQGDWVWIETIWGKVREVVDIYYGISKGIVNANHQWWYPEMDQPGHGWDLVSINYIMIADNQDPTGGCANMRSVPVKVYKATADNSPFGNPVPCDRDGNPAITSASDPRLKSWMPDLTLNA